MDIDIILDDKNKTIIFECRNITEENIWDSFSNLISKRISSASEYKNTIRIPLNVFIQRKDVVKDAKNRLGINFTLSPDVKTILLKAKTVQYSDVCYNTPLDQESVADVLKSKGFIRELKPYQLRNVSKMVAFPAAASFSVPGAGKTTEALAYITYFSQPNDVILIVAPLSAFGPWDEEYKQCFGKEYSDIRRLIKGRENIQKILDTKPNFTIINYDTLINCTDLIEKYLDLANKSGCQTFMVLDESHRIKGKSKRTNAVLTLNTLPTKKLILSGTPMPQGYADLIPQLQFLYPELEFTNGEEERASNQIQPLFVRTTKNELGLKKPEIHLIKCHFTPAQSAFYELLKSETARELQGIRKNFRRELHKIGICTTRLLQYSSNPALLSDLLDYAFSPKLTQAIVSGESAKIEYVCMRVRELASKNEKTIIWTYFVKNIELLNQRLLDLGADFIKGGVNPGDEDDLSTRDGKIKRFKTDPNAMVLIINPAAASEGISLHKVCHHAIYLDRTFNAAQFLQSEDRIHRLGLDPGIDTHIEIPIIEGSIDEIVLERLNEKINKMADTLGDSSISISTEYDYEDEAVETGNLKLDDDDVKAILSYLGE